MATPDRTNPPDLPAGVTARRLLGLVWDERRVVAIALVCALVYTALSLALPVVVQRIIDDGIVPADDALLYELLGLLVVLALLRSGIAFCRRYATATIGIRVEARMRRLLYDGYLRLPASLLRPAGHGAGRLARDQRPVPHPLLRRLGRRCSCARAR